METRRHQAWLKHWDIDLFSPPNLNVIFSSPYEESTARTVSDGFKDTCPKVLSAYDMPTSQVLKLVWLHELVSVTP